MALPREVVIRAPERSPGVITLPTSSGQFGAQLGEADFCCGLGLLDALLRVGLDVISALRHIAPGHRQSTRRVSGREPAGRCAQHLNLAPQTVDVTPPCERPREWAMNEKEPDDRYDDDVPLLRSGRRGRGRQAGPQAVSGETGRVRAGCLPPCRQRVDRAGAAVALDSTEGPNHLCDSPEGEGLQRDEVRRPPTHPAEPADRQQELIGLRFTVGPTNREIGEIYKLSEANLDCRCDVQPAPADSTGWRAVGGPAGHQVGRSMGTIPSCTGGLILGPASGTGPAGAYTTVPSCTASRGPLVIRPARSAYKRVLERRPGGALPNAENTPLPAPNLTLSMGVRSDFCLYLPGTRSPRSRRPSTPSALICRVGRRADASFMVRPVSRRGRSHERPAFRLAAMRASRLQVCSGRTRRDVEPLLGNPDCDLGPRGEPELAQDVIDVVGGRTLGDDEQLGDPSVG
jgi:hypothetical protein